MPDFTPRSDWPEHLEGLAIHMAGAKGTGMCALAELLVAAGARVSGSDVEEQFYTDVILAELGISVQSFKTESLGEASVLIRSAAYDESNPVVAEAMRRGLPSFTYPEALGALSRRFDASGVAGVHGKTTTAALAGTILQSLDNPATVVVGSAVSGFGDRSTWRGGDKYLVAETCEYRRHFLNFSPRRIVLTSIESDHQDYYPDYDSIRDAFREYIASLPEGGALIYCSDDAGAAEAAAWAMLERPDIRLTPYGENADGAWRISFAESAAGRNGFRLEGFSHDFNLRIPGRHIVLDAVAAMALAWLLEEDHRGVDSLSVEAFATASAAALDSFHGSRRRSEIIGEASGILFMDDYAHHPTAISATLRGLKEFHPDRRLVVDFQAHTYSRTAALLEEFFICFPDADVLLLQPIYASARESYDGRITGESFRDGIAAERIGLDTIYCESLDTAAAHLRGILQPGDLFITLGAGNNRPLGQRLFTEKSGEISE